jgi:hypothetical protein
MSPTHGWVPIGRIHWKAISHPSDVTACPVAFGGDAARAIDCGKPAIRLSPLDAMSFIPQGVIGFGNFLLGKRSWHIGGQWN